MIDFRILPTINAGLNVTSAVLLLTGFYFIRKRRIAAHRACMIGGLIVSGLFLVSYLTYHFNVGSVPFTGSGALRTVYFTILLTHTILAAIVLPMALRTAAHGLADRRKKHVRLARWTLPIWVYVSITGVVVYWMLYQM